MVKTRTQEDDPKGKAVDTDESEPQWFSRFRETNDQRFSQLEAMVAELYAERKQTNPRSDDRSTIDRSTSPLVKVKGDGSDHFGRYGDDRRFGGNDRMSGEIREGLVHKAIWEEKSIPQSKVSIPQSNSEILKRSEPEKVDIGLEKLEHVVMNEVDGDVEEDQKVMSDTKIYSALQLFDQMTLRIASKQKRRKSLKAWKFKFKTTSKRSKCMDDRFSFVEETALLNKDPKETMWDYVKKEFKETMAACGKKRVDRFKLVEEKESRLEVLDLNQTLMYHQIGHGVDTLLVLKSAVHDKEMAVVRQGATSLMICDCSKRSSRANRVWEPGGLLKFQEVLIDDELSVMVCLRMVETSSDLLLLNGKENEGCLNGSQALVLMKGITESSSRIEELMKEEPDFVKVNEVKMEKQKQRKCSKCWMFKFRKENIDQWLGGYNLIATYLENKKTWMFKYKAPNLDTKVLETSGQCIRKSGSASADRESESNQPTLRFSTWVIEILLNHYMVLLLTPVAYAIHFLGGVGLDKKQSHLSLWINRVWDPGGSLVKDASYSTRIFSSLPATVPVSLLSQESLANQVTSFSTNLEVKVSLKGGDLIQDKRREKRARVAREKEISCWTRGGS